MKFNTKDNEILHQWIGEHGRFDLDGEQEIDDAGYASFLSEAQHQHPNESGVFHDAWAKWVILTKNKVSSEFTKEYGDQATSELAKWANCSEVQSKAFNKLCGQIDAVQDAYSKEANNLGQIFEELKAARTEVRIQGRNIRFELCRHFEILTNKLNLHFGDKKERDEQAKVRESHRDIIDWAFKIGVLGLLAYICFLKPAHGQSVNIAAVNNVRVTSANLPVNCVVGCSGGTTDTDDNSVASGQSTGIQIGLGYVYNGAAWVRMIGDGTNGLTVQCATGCSGGTQYTEDAVAAANPIGSAINLVRQDTPAGLVTTDGDNVALRGTNYGAAYVTLLDTAGSAVSVGGGTQYTEDAAAAANPIGTALNLVRADALAGLTTTDGDNVAARGTDKGELYVKHVDAIPVTDNGGELTVNYGSGTFIVGDGAGALNVICDSGCSGGTQYTEDVASAADPVGTMGMAVRADALAAVTTTDGDNIAFRATNKGELYVKQTDAVTVTDGAGALNVIVDSGTITTITNAVTVTDGAGALNTIVDSGTLTGITNQIDTNLKQVAGGNTQVASAGLDSTGTGILATGLTGQLDDVATTAVTENQFAHLRVTSARNLKTDISTIAGTAPTTAGKIDVKGADGDVFVRQATAANLNMTEASAASILTSVQLIDDGVYTDDTSTHSTGSSKGYAIMGAATPTDTAVNANDFGVVGMTNNRELYVSLRDISGTAAVSGSGNATGALRVEIANNGTGLVGLNAGTNAIGKLAANSGVDIGDVDVTSISGQTAEDTAAANAEVVNRNGCVRNDADGTAFTSSGTDGDWTHVACDSYGALMTTGQHPLQWTYHENSSSALTDTTVHASCGAGLYNYITSITFSTGGATAASILIEDSTTTTILGPWYLEAVSGRGLHVTFPTPKKQTNSATLVSVTTTGAVTHGLDVQGFCAP